MERKDEIFRHFMKYLVKQKSQKNVNCFSLQKYSLVLIIMYTFVHNTYSNVHFCMFLG